MTDVRDADEVPHEYKWDARNPWEFRAEVDAEGFWDVLTAVQPLVDECRMKITPDGVSITAVDPANVAAVHLEKDIVQQADGEVTVGLHLNDLVENTPPHFDGNSYRLTIQKNEDENNKLRVVHTSEGIHDSLAINPDTVRSPPEWPEFDEEQQFTMSAPKVRGVLGAMAEATNWHVRLSTDQDELTVEAVEDGDVRCTWDVPAGVSPGTESGYSADYLTEIAEGMWHTGEVTVRFGTEQPLELEREGLKYVLACRIIRNND